MLFKLEVQLSEFEKKLLKFILAKNPNQNALFIFFYHFLE